MEHLTLALWIWCLAVGFAAGVVKGMVGFAMPMVMFSGLGSLVSPELALAGLILPTVATNLWQSLRQGPRAAWEAIKRFRLFIGLMVLALIVSSQLVRVIPDRVILLVIGVPIVLFAVMQLIGREIRLRPSRLVEACVGAFAGFIGGFSGIWGPPTVVYLTALDVPKQEHVRIQGVIYGIGAVTLVGAHLASGVLRAETAPFSLALLPAALLGMALGFAIQDRIDQVAFRRATLAVLLIAGLNLLRRGLF